MFNNPYFQNVASEFIALVIIVIIGWLYIYYVKGRRGLPIFFNIKTTKRIVIYLSNLRIINAGALGIDNQPRSFAESAIPRYEVNFVPLFQRLFNLVIPGLNDLPGFLRGLFISDVRVDFIPSPLKQGDVERRTTFIAVGSPGYNIASRLIEDEWNPRARFVDDNTAVSLRGMPPQTDPTYAFVQRVFNQGNGQTAFYIAGISSRGTAGAAYYLASQWDTLATDYPNNTPFCIMLEITSADARQYVVISRT